MKKFLNKIILSPLFWTILIFIGFFLFIPPFYQKYNLELIKTERNNNRKTFYEDLDSDGYSEKIVSENKFEFNSFIFSDKKDSIVAQISVNYSTTDNELCKFEDYNQNGLLEFYFFTISNDSIFLNGIEYQNPPKYIFKQKFITNISKNHKEEYDISTNDSPAAFDLNNDGYKEIYFYISTGYSYYLRKVFAYDIITDSVYSSPESGAKLMIPTFCDFNNDNSPEIFFRTYATNNFDSLIHKDNYPDTSAWLMLLDKDLKFLFEPVEFYPKGTKIQPYPIKNPNTNKFDIFVLKTSFVDNHSPTIAYIYNIKGEQTNKRELSEISKKNVFFIENRTDSSKIIFIDEFGYLYVYNYNLIFEKKQKVIDLKNSEHISVGVYDINNDNEIEYLFWHQSGMTVTDMNFNNPVFVSLENNGLEFPSIIKSIDGNTYFWYKTVNDNWYMLQYTKNPNYYYRFFIFIIIFGIIFLFLWLIMTLRSKKLEADNKKLNKVVKDRTYEITNQKEELYLLNKKLIENFEKTEQQNIKINLQNIELEEMYKELKDFAKYRELNTQMTVHDLKNPLNRIISVGKNKKSDKKLYNSAQYMLNLVENILSVTKIEQTGLCLNPTAVNLQESIENAYENTEFLFKNKGLIFENNSLINFKVLAENEILKRIFINLFTNAVKYTNSGGKVCVLINKKNNLAEITVKDNGVGIKQEKLEKVFEIYEQNSVSKPDKVSSSGIGLFFVKNAVEALEGKIEVKSELKKGTSFIFTLKIVENIGITKKIVSFEKQLQFSDDEKNKLKNIINELKTTELYEVSKIKRIIKNFDFDTPNLENWKIQLEKSIANYNTDLYQKLISKV